MHLFVDYVQPLTFWLHDHPHWALLITFLISCAESLAIIGSIIPGSLTMTAIGILSGSGVMPIDLTLCFAALGALVGDSASYALGYIFSDRLAQIWPFNHYPKLMRYGKDFFLRHGGKSVLIGRFVGPLRSIIPVIAGMMRMPQFQFFISNFLSAIGWAILYVMPGYFIGTASHQLSNESAKRLVMFIIVLLLGIWLGGRGIHWLARFINRWYTKHIRTLCVWSKNHAYLKLFFRDLREDHAANEATVTLLFLWLSCVIISLIFIIGGFQGTWLYTLNEPTMLFLHSLRTQLFDIFFILMAFLVHPLTLLALCVITTAAMIYAKDWRLLRFWLSLVGTTLLLTWVLAKSIFIPTLPSMHVPAMFLDQQIAWATALFTFILFYLAETTDSEIYSFLRLILILILVLAGFAHLYLGDSCFTSVVASYFIGLSISLIYWIMFQRMPIQPRRVNVILVLSAVVMLLTSGLIYRYHFHRIYTQHLNHPQSYKLTEEAWWYQDKPLLPLYTTNRIGKHIGVFNIQYVGSLKHLEQQLNACGWQKQSKTWLYTLLLRVNGEHAMESFPLMEQLYLNKKPALTMTYRVRKNGNLFLLRLWLSNYYLNHNEKPIWLGSVVFIKKKNQFSDSFQPISSRQWSTLFAPIYPALKNYQVRSLVLKDSQLKSLRYVIPPELLMIKNTTDV